MSVTLFLKAPLTIMEFVWCNDCGQVQPLVVDYLPAGTLRSNDHAAQDLVCGECHVIIATLHETRSQQ